MKEALDCKILKTVKCVSLCKLEFIYHFSFVLLLLLVILIDLTEDYGEMYVCVFFKQQ